MLYVCHSLFLCDYRQIRSGLSLNCRLEIVILPLIYEELYFDSLITLNSYPCVKSDCNFYIGTYVQTQYFPLHYKTNLLHTPSRNKGGPQAWKKGLSVTNDLIYQELQISESHLNAVTKIYSRAPVQLDSGITVCGSSSHKDSPLYSVSPKECQRWSRIINDRPGVLSWISDGSQISWQIQNMLLWRKFLIRYRKWADVQDCASFLQN